jgi:hypothetical protein
MDTLLTFITGWLCVWYGCKLRTLKRPLVLMDCGWWRWGGCFSKSGS